MTTNDAKERQAILRQALLDIVCFFAGCFIIGFALGWQVGLGVGLVAFSIKSRPR